MEPRKPTPDQIFEKALEFTDLDSVGGVDGLWPYFQFAKGLAEYRNGNFAEASTWFERLLIMHPKDWHLKCQAMIVSAMVHHRLGQTDQAKHILSDATQVENEN